MESGSNFCLMTFAHSRDGGISIEGVQLTKREDGALHPPLNVETLAGGRDYMCTYVFAAA
jgi:hypothetical protein